MKFNKFVFRFRGLTQSYAAEYPLKSDSLLLYWRKPSDFNARKFRCHESRVPTQITHPLLQENMDIINSQEFYHLASGWQKFNYFPKSCIQSLDAFLGKVWIDYRQHLDNFRKGEQDFNTVFVSLRRQSKVISDKKEELYSNLFLTISITQIQILHEIKQEMKKIRHRVIKSYHEFSAHCISYMILLKHQQAQILESTAQMIELYALQYFELFDLQDYQSYIRRNLDMINRNFQMSKSPYSMLRNLSKK